MTLAVPRPVIVKQLPQTCDGAQIRTFLSTLNAELATVVRPSVVLDCARMQKVDVPVLNLLLCCLEETMKRNGDVRLAAIPPVARLGLESAGVRHLFRIFGTCADAVNSFHRPIIQQPIPERCSPAQADAGANAA